ncbi:MAG: hypothetical protein IPL94_09895 [Tetrasphaera sp.]|nr:hypothetical protein [Tetrasphaera sp.]
MGEREAMRRQFLRRNEGGAVGGDGGELVVLGAVVDQEQRGGSAGGPGMGDTVTGTSTGVSRRGERVVPAVDVIGAEPPRCGVAWQFEDGTFPEGGPHAYRVVVIEDDADVLLPGDRKPVFQAGQARPGQVELPRLTRRTVKLPRTLDRSVALENERGDVGVADITQRTGPR